MHEYPITEQIVRMSVDFARENKACRICRISLVVGEMSGFIGDSIQMYFDIIAKETLAEGAVLEIEYIKPKLRCSSCGLYFERAPFSFACPRCQQDGVPTEIGKEFYLKDIEIELDEGDYGNNGEEKN